MNAEPVLAVLAFLFLLTTGLFFTALTLVALGVIH